MDEYCGYEVEDVHSGTVLDEVMCETCGTIQPATNKVCSYCGEKLKGGGRKNKQKEKKNSHEENVDSFFVERTHRTEKLKPKPVEASVADNSVIEAEPVKLPEAVSLKKPELQPDSPNPATNIVGGEKHSSEVENLYSKPKKKRRITVTGVVLWIMCGTFLITLSTIKTGKFFGQDLTEAKPESHDEIEPAVVKEVLENGDIVYDFGELGVGVVGEDIPEGEYFVYCNETEYDDNYGYVSVHSKLYDGINFYKYFGTSMYLTLDKEVDGVVNLYNCKLYKIKEPFKENDPFKQPGMYKVGFDLEPGTYNVVAYGEIYQPCIYVRNNSKYDYESFYNGDSRYDESLFEQRKVKVEKGDYLELEHCRLERIDEGE